MKLHTIWVQDDPSEGPWLYDTWDEQALDENFGGWENKVEAAKKEHLSYRIVIIEVPAKPIVDSFKPLEL